MMSTKITRTELYNQVWATPILRLSRIVGYSDVAVAKICRKHKIPCPPRGYWAKKRVGKAPRQTPLPDAQTDYLIQLREPNMSHTPSEAREKSREKRPHIKLADSLRGCHKLVRLANEQLQGADTDMNSILALPKEPILEVRVSKGSLRRALLIMDALLKALEALSYNVDRGPSVKIQEASVRFWIAEGLETKQEQPKEHDLNGDYRFGYNRFNKKRVPSGRLELCIPQSCIYWGHGYRRTWRDGKKPLEDRLDRFVAGLEEMAARIKAHEEEEKRKAEQRRAEEVRRQEEARQRAEKRARFEAEHARVESLRQQVRNWKEAEDLRKLIETVKQKYLEQHTAIEPDGQFAQWLEWATQQADRLDPFRPSPPSILDEKIEEVKNESGARRTW